MSDSILVINTGSSSIKFQVFNCRPVLKCLRKGKIVDLGLNPSFMAMDSANQAQTLALPADCNHEEALHFLFRWFQEQNQGGPINTVTHRIVHGGERYTSSVVITPEVMAYLRQLCPLAPLHQPHNLMAVDIFSAFKPELVQIACFDTAFHAGHDPLLTAYALPQTLRDQGIRRYGFHGLSYEWLAHSLRQNEPELIKKRLVAAHLGNGASLCAMNNGCSVDTTMGMTALDGLPMGTRCGSLDPGAVIYMTRELQLSPDEAESILYYESGLRGLSQWTQDVRLLQNSEDPRARFALDFFCLRTAQFAGMMAVSLGGIDGLVFTGGIGENAETVRDRIVHSLDFLRPFEVRVIEANEEHMMALHTLTVLENQKEERT
ncbi:acetate/propionate family kinase [Legionella taurinensis]|uniref:Acetate kinase n=1 Tax=Legionella taurinensis TaxID=70611 RepID=A0A3A5L3X5_9GAMM|nr:acetate/propionate family kinase [Legionella taurinensis]RJT46931.1 acetate/propionate family kinase [Legionella taurinensis]RJT66868.1 acetate/propionate family kinase [Legionella taurinensis]STY25406.1 acetate kinase [Legionella taurinensis]